MKLRPLILGLLAGAAVGLFMGRKATGGMTPGFAGNLRQHVQG